MKITEKLVARRFATTSEIVTRGLAFISGLILLIVPIALYNHYKPGTFIDEHGYTTIKPNVLSSSTLNFLDWFSFLGIIAGLILVFWGLYFFCQWIDCLVKLKKFGFSVKDDVVTEINSPYIILKHNGSAYIGIKAKEFRPCQHCWAVNSANCLLVFDKDNYDK